MRQRLAEAEGLRHKANPGQQGCGASCSVSVSTLTPCTFAQGLHL